jgi:hypothetical protein
MQLKYRGIAYQPAFVEDQVEDSAQLGLSRRQAAQSDKPAKPNLRKPGDELVYRGVRYTK